MNFLVIIGFTAVCFTAQAVKLPSVIVQNSTLNSQWEQLASSTVPNMTFMESCVDNLLDYLTPEIENIGNYTGQFSGQCWVFFDHQINHVDCDFNNTQVALVNGGVEQITGIALPYEHWEALKKNYILLSMINADWSQTNYPGRYQAQENHFWPKQNPCPNTISPPPTPTATQPINSTATSSHSDTSYTVSRTASATQLSSTPTHTSTGRSFPPTLTLTLTKTPSISNTATYNPTTTQTLVHSQSLSGTVTRTWSRSLAQSLSHTLSRATQTLVYNQSLSGTATRTWSHSLAQSLSHTLSHSPKTHSSSYDSSSSPSLNHSSTSSNTPSASPDCAPNVPSMNGLLSAWHRSTGVYDNAVNQVGRYTVSNGVVTDTLTNMQWEQTAGTTPMPFTSVSGYCTGRNTGGFTDWRAPNIVELGTLVDYTSSTPPYLNTTAFPGAQQSEYWSGSSDIGDSGNSWYVSLSSGNYGISSRQPTLVNTAARCVRSCYPTPSSSRYTVGTGAATGTVTDNVTELVWQKVASGGTYMQSAASSYCSSLSLGGSGAGTWRLPTVRELQTLVDYSKNYNSLMMDTTVFSGELASTFFSSSSVPGNPAAAWSVNFNVGDTDAIAATVAHYVRCVK